MPTVPSSRARAARRFVAVFSSVIAIAIAFAGLSAVSSSDVAAAASGAAITASRDTASAAASTVAGSWETTGRCDSPSNRLVVHPVAGVTYTWTAGPNTGSFASYSGSKLLGTYAFSVAVTNPSAYTLGNSPTSFSTTFVAPTGCNPPRCIEASQVTYTYTPATNSGTVTVPNPAGSNGKLLQRILGDRDELEIRGQRSLAAESPPEQPDA